MHAHVPVGLEQDPETEGGLAENLGVVVDACEIEGVGVPPDQELSPVVDVAALGVAAGIARPEADMPVRIELVLAPHAGELLGPCGDTEAPVIDHETFVERHLVAVEEEHIT